MSTLFNKISITFLSFLILFFSIAPNFALAKAADSTWYDQGFFDWFVKVYDQSNQQEIFGERYTAAQVQWVVWGLISFLIPNKPVVSCIMGGGLDDCLSILNIADISTNNTQNNESLLSLVFDQNRTFSGISYVREHVQNLSLVPVAHAQQVGFGFQALEVIQDFWASVRNVVYSLFVLIAVILSFMIMFRIKINPQTVITVQSAIPKLIIALILVTFSYAIAGFVVDFMYIVIGLFSLIIAESGSLFVSNPAIIFKFLTTGYIGLGSTINLPLGIFGVFVMYMVIFPIILFAALLSQNGGVSAAMMSIFSAGGVPALVALISIIVFVILFILLMVNFLKIMWMLIKAFANFLLLVIFGPFQIALGVIMPNIGFGSWIKSLVSTLAVFPVTGILLAMSFVFLKLAASVVSSAFLNFKWWDLLGILGPTAGDVFGQQFNGWPPLLNGPRGMLSLVYLGVSFVFITLVPKATEIIQGFITGKPFAYGSAIGEAWGTAKGVGGFAYGQTAKPYVEGYMKKRGDARAQKALEPLKARPSDLEKPADRNE